MGEESQHFRRKTNWVKYALACVGGILVAAFAVGIILYSGGNSTNVAAASSAEPVLGAAEMCGTCTLIPGVDAYKMCHTCYTPLDEPARLNCANQEAVIVTKVKSDDHSLRATDLALVYNECQQNRLDDGSCEIVLQELRDPEEEIIEPEPPIEPRLTRSHPGEFKVYYMCVTEDVFFDPEPEAEYTLSAVRSNDFEVENFPLLSSTLVKCGKRKLITENWEKGRECVSTLDGGLDTPVVFSCDSTRLDARILIAKVKTTSTVELEKKFRKTLAVRTTDLCAENMNSGACSVTLADAFQEGETLPEDGAEIQLSYLCSYGPESVVV